MYVDGNLFMLMVIYTAADSEVFLHMCPEVVGRREHTGRETV